MRKHLQRFAWCPRQPPRPPSDLGIGLLAVLSTKIPRAIGHSVHDSLRSPAPRGVAGKGVVAQLSLTVPLVLCRTTSKSIIAINYSVQYWHRPVGPNSGITPRAQRGLHHDRGVHTMAMVSLAGGSGLVEGFLDHRSGLLAAGGLLTA